MVVKAKLIEQTRIFLSLVRFGRKPKTVERSTLIMGRKEKVTRVIDGDTFRTNYRKKAVRLANVDAPEKGHPGAAQATQKLRRLIGGQEVRIDTVARDRYGRAVANVYLGRELVNKKMRGKTAK